MVSSSFDFENVVVVRLVGEVEVVAVSSGSYMPQVGWNGRTEEAGSTLGSKAVSCDQVVKSRK